tara:strand:+ start:1008 stop:1229 length:222 start_codon:yes stop_codon:yes gene_type:complete
VPDGAVVDIFASQGASDAAGSGFQVALGFVVWLIPYYVLNWIIAPKLGLIEEPEPEKVSSDDNKEKNTKEPWQ